MKLECWKVGFVDGPEVVEEVKQMWKLKKVGFVDELKIVEAVEQM
jgi:hypothetical protein